MGMTKKIKKRSNEVYYRFDIYLGYENGKQIRPTKTYYPKKNEKEKDINKAYQEWVNEQK